MNINRRYLALACAGALAVLGAGSAHDALAQAGDEAAVAAAVESFRTAMLKADKAKFDALCAEQMSYGHSAGRLETKAEFIAASTSGKTTWNFITLSDATVKVVGDNAIARHILTGETLNDGKTTAIKIGILMVWQKQGADWKLLARQAYRIQMRQPHVAGERLFVDCAGTTLEMIDGGRGEVLTAQLFVATLIAVRSST